MVPTNLGLVICGNYYKELQTVMKGVDATDVQMLFIKPDCLSFEKEEKNSVSEKIEDFRQTVSGMNVLALEVCSGKELKEREGCHFQYLCPAFCSEMMAPKAFLDQRMAEGDYMVTPGWVVNWKSIVLNKWKFTESNAKSFFNDTVKRICVLDTGVHEDYQKFLDEFSSFAGLEYHVVHIGLDYFRLFIEKQITAWHHEVELNAERKKVKESSKKLADYTMALEILKDLFNLSSEKALVYNIFRLFAILFSPQKMQYVPVVEGMPAKVQDYSLADFQETDLLIRESVPPVYEVSKSRNGFRINASYENEVLGYLKVEDILFAEHIDAYTALTSSISSVLGLLIYNSRQYGKILREKIEILESSEMHLKSKNEELKMLNMELQASEEEIRASNEELRATAEELIETNTKLEAARKKAEESDHLKTAFLHNMSHEIRTPLNAILGFSSMLPEHFANQEKLRYFSEIINRRGNDLLEIIDGILDIAKIESGQMTVHLEPCDLGKLLSDIEVFFKEYQKQLKRDLVSFSVSHSFMDSGVVVMTDVVKLKQVFVNLINNAFKFTSEGKIVVGSKGVENGMLVFYVTDSGIGIPREKHLEIFNRFMQVNNQNSRLYGGTGLGLSIVKGLLNLLGGEVWVESEPDHGSTFYFSIPFNQVGGADLPVDKASAPVVNNSSTAMILIVEDDVFNAEYLREVLSNLNCHILHASTGSEAIEMSVKMDLDIVLMDIRLPDMSGFEVTHLIKDKNPNLVIIAQTAYASSMDRMRALGEGCDDYVSKPVNREALLSKISGFISSKCR